MVDSVDKERIGISKNEMVSMLEEEELKKGNYTKDFHSHPLFSHFTRLCEQTRYGRSYVSDRSCERIGTSSIKVRLFTFCRQLTPVSRERKWQIFKTSAVKGTGLDEAMEWLVEALKSRQ